ncbi:MAG: F0F1 ATP synthase subunit A [Defluviitaleaceae bacterium]|nr:F0F1 ATP synthase subunit A [Defluviitaleaceae bacterium]
MDFGIRAFHRWYITDYFFITITETVIAMWIIGALLIALAIIVRIKLKKFKDVPETRFQNIVETIVETFDNFVTNTMTPKYAHFGNYFFGLFAFILLSNLSGLFGLRPPTADFAMTYPLALTTVILVQFMGIRYNMKKGEYLKEIFLRPVPIIFAPLNIIGEFSRSISLSLRLFGNIVGGLIVMSLIYSLFPWWLQLGPPGALAIYFEFIVGALHAFIFVMLSMLFMMMKAPQTD